MLEFSKAFPSRQRVLLYFIVITTFMLASSASAQQIQTYQYPNPNGDVQKQLYTLTLETQNLVENVGRFRQMNPVLLSRLNQQLVSLQSMTPEELDALSAAVPELIELRKQINELNILLTEQMIDVDHGSAVSLGSNPAGFIADGWKVGCPVDGGGLYGPFETILHTPGPCNQLGLTDAGYPYVCPFSTPTEVLIISRVVLAIAKTIASSTEKICYQSVFGNNASSGCIALEVIRVVLLGVLDTLANCNDKRSAAETFGTYARTGDLFFSNKTNFGTQNNAMQVTLTQVGDAETALTTDVTTSRGRIDDALENGFSGTDALLTDLETKSIQNAHSLDLVLARQRLIMRELGIESSYRDPNTDLGSGTSFELAPAAKEKPKPAPDKTGRIFRRGESAGEMERR